MLPARPAKIVLSSVIALFVLGRVALSWVPERPARPIRATVIRIVVTVNSLSAYASVRLRAPDGRIGVSGVPMNELACRPGDVVDAEEVGINVRLRGKACRHPSSSPWVPDPPSRS